MAGDWIGVDLDGTLAEYDGWIGPDHIGKPVELMLSRVKQWIAAGKDVRIFTARVDGGDVALSAGDENGKYFQDVTHVKSVIEQWCLNHIGVVLPITNKKDYGCIEI